MRFLDRTINSRVYKCQSCAWEGKKPDFEYRGHKKGRRICPICGSNVKSLHNERTRKEEMEA